MTKTWIRTRDKFGVSRISAYCVETGTWRAGPRAPLENYYNGDTSHWMETDLCLLLYGDEYSGIEALTP